MLSRRKPSHGRAGALGLLTALIAIAYIDRVSVAHAIGPASVEFGWNPIQTGWILSAFSWGYVVAMIPGGWLVDRIGGRRATIGGATLWGVISASAAAATGAWVLALNRFLLGMAEAPAFPAAASVTAQEFEAVERGRATALFDGGSYIGMAVGAPLIAGAVATAGWRAGFLVAAGITAVWLLAAMTLFGFHRGGRPLLPEGAAQKTGPRVPFLLRQRSVWALGLGFLGYNFVKSFYLTWFVLYLTGSLGLSAMASGVASAFPPLLAVAASLSVGLLTDKLALARPESEIGRLRGRITSTAMAGAALIAIVPMFSTDALRITVLSIAFAANISASPGIWALPGDLAPNVGWVGTIGGVVNTMSNIGGIVSPIITGYLVQLAGGGYELALRATGGVALMSAAIFLAGGRYRRLVVAERP